MDIADVKKELSSDEKILESAFKLETLYKKYKFFIWGIAIALLLFFAGTTAMDAIKQAKLEEANSAFLTLQNKADDAAALATLKEKNPALYELFIYAQAAKNKDAKTLSGLANSSNEVIADASKYTAAVIEKKPVDSKLYKEMALLEEAYLAIKAGDAKKAKAKLELIDERSPFSMVAQLLKHSVLKAK
ncbi:hypothetical protein [Sulfurovum sp.]|uniref:hypothetical protein n=1 Tax=Sulfurovum sp. TaxID=1969726 RepID=UPI0025DD1D6D|nr:hypothetical protein [Sulfurovum sp.]